MDILSFVVGYISVESFRFVEDSGFLSRFFGFYYL